MSEVPMCVLKADGINCEEETAEAFRQAGAKPEIVHLNELIAGDKSLLSYRGLALSGGFSYGDHVKSGIILATELRTQIGDQMREFLEKQGIVVGICNGFQALIEANLLPSGDLENFTRTASLEHNLVDPFLCDWTKLKVEKNSPCEFIQNMDEQVTFQIAHGEGRFVASDTVLRQIEQQKLVAFRYVDKLGNPANGKYPDNPNGSMHDIAGITNPTGNIIGLMPHPERHIFRHQFDNWRREPNQKLDGLPFFKGIVSYAAQS